jgi:hypothetical protein
MASSNKEDLFLRHQQIIHIPLLLGLGNVIVLELCKFVWLIKKTKEVTYKPTLDLVTSLLNSKRALSCHLVFL